MSKNVKISVLIIFNGPFLYLFIIIIILALTLYSYIDLLNIR